ncbi:MAG TPA: YggT family protein [Thiolapillus brandeum]|uniref:YggT family protein n=1 Tax=Thiolapillus brandeum TaxID=1076588 RepID=A0A7C5MXR4_9GAMM|nr:YggT family protein [Thiolapillus brandeum]
MMGSDYLTNPLVFLFQTLFDLYILVVLLRFLLQLVRADFYNPISQFVVKITSPLLLPLRRVVPAVRGLDTASLVLAWGLKTLELVLVLWFTAGSLSLLLPLLMAIPELVELTINIFFWAILIQAILSWVNPGVYNPASALLYSLTLPLLRPAQRIIPPIGGIDLSPMAVMLGLIVLKMLILPPLRGLAVTLGA